MEGESLRAVSVRFDIVQGLFDTARVNNHGEKIANK